MGTYDVIVVGGGISGSAAAIAASKNGAKTLLIERYGFLGGWGTAALVNPFMSSKTSEGQELVGGFYQELLTQLTAEENGLLGTCFDPELMKSVLMEMVLESGSEISFHSLVTSAGFNGNLISMNIFSKSGTYTIFCQRAVDCSGDGDIAVSLGAEYESGDEDGVPQAATLMFDVGGVNVQKALEYVKSNPDEMRFPKLPENTDLLALSQGVYSVAGYYSLVSQAKNNGEYPVPGDLVFYISRPRQGEVTFNTTHVGGVDGVSTLDLTRAEIQGRRQMIAVLNFARKYLPGFEDAYIARSPVHVGIRESRRIIGEYVFSEDDVAESRKFDDAICRLAYWADVHTGKGSGYTRSEEKQRLIQPKPGNYYEIPYRCLLPKKVDNLLVAGRCVSSTQRGHGAIRIMPSCMAMGQAAGTAVALSCEMQVPLNEIEMRILKQRLRFGGALV